MPQTKEVHREYMRKRREGSQLYPPSQFLSSEEDMKVQLNVVNTLKAMSGPRRQVFEALGNTFTPNKVRLKFT